MGGGCAGCALVKHPAGLRSGGAISLAAQAGTAPSPSLWARHAAIHEVSGPLVRLKESHDHFYTYLSRRAVGADR